MPQPSPPSPALLWFRGSVFAVVGAWLIGGPIVRGVLDHDELFWLPRWEMFGKACKDICEVEFYTLAADGSRQAVDWVEATGGNRDTFKERKKHRISTVRHAFRIGERICERMDDGTDLRVRMRCGSTNTWQRRRTTKVNLCSDQARAAFWDQRK